MALFEKKTWKDRLTEFPGRRKITDVSTNVSTVVDVARNEGNILQEGDAFNKTNMDDLEQRIEAAIGTGDIPEGLGNDIVSAITKLNSEMNALHIESGKVNVSFSDTPRTYIVNFKKLFNKPIVSLTVRSGQIGADARSMLSYVNSNNFCIVTYADQSPVDSGTVYWIATESTD